MGEAETEFAAKASAFPGGALTGAGSESYFARTSPNESRPLSGIPICASVSIVRVDNIVADYESVGTAEEACGPEAITLLAEVAGEL